MYLSLKGVIIKEIEFGEYDKYLTIITDKYGKLKVLAKGVRRKGNRLSSLSRNFCYANFTLFENRGYYTLNDIEIISNFFNISLKLEEYFLACYMLETCEFLSVESDSDELLRLLVCALYSMLNKNIDKAILKCAFELRLIKILGYEPQLEYCGVCNQDKIAKAFLSVSNGTIVCEACVNRLYSKMHDIFFINKSLLQALIHILFSNIDRIFLFNIGEDNLKVLGEISEKYILHHSDIYFRTLKMYKNLEGT